MQLIRSSRYSVLGSARYGRCSGEQGHTTLLLQTTGLGREISRAVEAPQQHRAGRGISAGARKTDQELAR